MKRSRLYWKIQKAPSGITSASRSLIFWFRKRPTALSFDFPLIQFFVTEAFGDIPVEQL